MVALLGTADPLVQRYPYMPWLYVACLAILVVAATLHWRRTRHWCLLALATGSLLVALANVAIQIGVDILLTLLPDSETITFGTILFDISQWFMAAGAVIAAAGGIGAIHWAIRLKQRPQ